MIRVHKIGKYLIIEYRNRNGISWIYEKIENESNVTIKKTFKVTSADYAKNDEENGENFHNFYSNYSFYFTIGELEQEYFKIKKSILSITYDLYIHKDFDFSQRTFMAERNVSLFNLIEKIKPLDAIYIGGSRPDALSINEFENLLSIMPNNYELEKYSIARVSSILRNYFDSELDGESIFNKYLNRKQLNKNKFLETEYRDFEVLKYKNLLLKMRNLIDQEVSYCEEQWQDEIIKIILSIYPKYIKAIKEAPLKDYYNDKSRSIDILLVDYTSNVDVVEIKKPFDKCIVTKGLYRDNFVPLRELSGTVMQIEKYIFYLNKWGISGEKFLTEKYKDLFPTGFSIKITNPSGIIIMGRDNNLTPAQKTDFEIIRRKYVNVIDIITYDDLINRLDMVIKQLEISTQL